MQNPIEFLVKDMFENEDEAAIFYRYNSIGIASLDKIIDAIIRLYVHTDQYERALVGLERFAKLETVKEHPELREKVRRVISVCNEMLIQK